jgi:peptidoglycan hydrolase CwlO-like protein
MKLETVLSNLGSLEKNSFLKIIDTIISNSPENAKEIEEFVDAMLSDNTDDIQKKVDEIDGKLDKLMSELRQND